MKKIFTSVFVFLLFTQVSFAVTYYSQTSGAPHTLANWNTVRAGGGSTPGNFTTAGDFFVIQNTHTMTTTALWTVSGSGTTLQIESGGALTAASTFPVTIGSTATFQIDNGGTYTHSNTSAFGSTIMQGTESFGSSSTVIFTDWNSTGPIVSSWGNIVFNAPGAVAGSMQFSNNLTTVNGRLEIIATGSTPREIRLATTGSYTLTIGGDLIISGGIFNPASGASGGTRVINIGGNFNMTAGTFNHTNSTATTFNFTGTNKTWTQSGGTFTNANLTWGINSGASLTLASNFAIASTRSLVNNGTLDCATFAVTGAGAFTMGATNSTLRTGNTAGLSSTAATGSIQVLGTRTYNATGSGNTFVYNGSSAQNTGNQFPASLTNFTVSNTTGVTLDASVTVSGTASVTGSLDLGVFNMTQTGGAATLAGTGTIYVSGALGTQIGTYNTNTFQTTGRYWFTGNSQVIPSGTYEDMRVQGTGTTLSGDLTVNGDLEMQGTLSVGANTLTISNPITVNPTNLTMDATSSLVINGTAASIHVPSSVTALNNLTYNNSSLVTADANLTISGTFTLGTSGFIFDMGANTLEIGTSTANIGAISRIGSGSVRGILKRWTNTATSSLLFPLNNNATDYVGATVNFSVNPSTGGSLTARYTSTGSGLFPLGPNGIDRYIDFSAQHSGMNLINLSPQFWTISDADGLAGFTYGLSLEANNMGINTSGNNYQYTAVVKRNTGGGNTWAWSNSNHVTTGGNGSNPVPQCQGYTSFSDFAIGGNQDNLLPVELSNLTSAISGRDLLLSWSTGTEINNSGFDIERKSTTGGWSKIGFVAGHGTVNTPNSYTYTDANLSSGKYNYRLKQIDFNGNYKYYNLSNEVIIGTPSKYVLTQNFPNPFNPSTSISYEIPATNFVSLKIYDMMGKEVANLVNGTQEAGFYTVKFDASKLASGVYFYKLQANDFTATKKLMLMK